MGRGDSGLIVGTGRQHELRVRGQRIRAVFACHSECEHSWWYLFPLSLNQHASNCPIFRPSVTLSFRSPVSRKTFRIDNFHRGSKPSSNEQQTACSIFYRQTTSRSTSTVLSTRSRLYTVYSLSWSMKRAVIFSLDKEKPKLGISVIGSGLG